MKPGDKVYYLPFKGCSFKDVEFGIVKSLNEFDPSTVFVVFKCGEDWDMYQEYTGQNVKIQSLCHGWTGSHEDSNGHTYSFVDKEKVSNDYYMDKYFMKSVGLED